MKVRRLVAVPLAALLWLMLVAVTYAAPPQSDDFAGTSLKGMWKSADIGQEATGSVTVNNGKILPIGAGADIWTTTFQFFYVYQENITGSFDVSVKVERTPFPDAADGWSGTGIVVTTPDALTWDGTGSTIPPWIETGLSNNNGVEMKWGAAGQSANATREGGIKPPVWLRLVKLGDTFTTFYSKDGMAWTELTSVTNPYPQFPMKDPLLVGIHVQAHEGAEMGDPVLSDFRAAALGGDANDKTPPAQVQDLVATTDGSDAITLNWTAPADAFLYEVRYALIPLTADNWAQGTRVAPPFPVVAGTKETLKVTGLQPLNRYYFAVRATDANGNLSGLSNVAPGSTADAPPGPLREVYTDIGGGTSVDDLRNSAKYPDKPDIKEYLTAFEAPTNVMDNYGQRISGILTAPVTGDYTFGIAGDDGCELWLSTDETPAKAELIANVASWTNSREWTKEENQTSSPITLQQGKKYYIEALMKEGGGGDNLAVRWILPDGTEEAPIPSTRVTAPGVAGALGRLSGVVSDGNGRPISGASVAVTTGGTVLTATANSQGYYSLLVPEGAVQAEVSFMRPWNDRKLKLDAGVKAGEITTLNLAFNLVAPPFKPAEPDAALSDNFDGASLNARWKHEDLGSPEPGDAKVANNQLVVSADGSDIWDGGDNGHYVYQEVTGDFEAVAHVLTVPTTDAWSKSGIMIRESTDTGSLHYFVATTRDNGIAAQGRINEIGGDTPENVNVNGGTFTQNTGYWVKLVRQGQKLWAFKSLDGVTYEFIAEQQHPGFADAKALLGLAVTSHNAGAVGDSIIDDFIVSKKVVPAPLEVTPPSTGKLGDFDKNDKVNILDVLTALRAVAGITPLTAEQQAVADVNSDGKFNITDVVFILRMAAGLITEFPKA